MNIQITKRILRARRQAGYSALFITMVLVGAAVLLMGSTLTRTTSNTRLNDRNATFISTQGAAEAAVEKVMARMMVDFQNYGEGQVISNLSIYQTQMLPTTTENPYWSNFVWYDGQGNSNAIYVARTSTNTNATFVALEEQWAGLSGYSSTYRILANCCNKSSSYNYGFTNAVQYDVQLAQIPVFQFAIFYNGLLEFSDAAAMTNNGPVHANTNIYTGANTSLVFNGMVTSSGKITSPDNAGFTSWSGTVTYNGTPSPGWLTGQPTLNLPVGTNSNSGSNVQQVLYPPPTGESVTSSMGQQRYYNKAGMTIWVSNDNNVYITLKSSASDPYPVGFTNTLNSLTNNPASNYFYFLSCTNKLKDWRENQTMDLTQIDVGKLTNWMQTNVYVYNSTSTSNKFSSSSPLNIIWVADWRTTNSSTSMAVRVMDGANLPSAGLTIATPNPLYVWGIYDCPNAAYQGTTNVTQSPPASFACDAITLLSPSWNDSKSFSAANNMNATADTVDAAIMAGNVPSTGTTSTTFSGGVHNLTRLLENWSGAVLTLNTSLVCLYSSTWATSPFQLPNAYYTAPASRVFSFNANYSTSSGMPPGTPYICRLVKSSWCNPEPDDVNYSSQTLAFIPH